MARFNQNVYNHIIARGGSDASARNAAKARRPMQALARWETAHSALEAQAAADYQRNLAMDRMAERQAQLMEQIAKPPPKASRSLKGQDYKPKFKASASKAETGRAVARGTYQFSNPLGMGSAGGGSRTGGMGGLA